MSTKPGEVQMSVETENDTGEVGIDEIPVTYPQTLEQTFCWEDDDPQAFHFMELIDSEGSEILRVDVNGECITELIEAGNYVMAIHHDGRMEDTFPIFIIPNSDDIEQVKETGGLLNRFNSAVANILKDIQNTVSKDAIAQQAGVRAIETLLQSNGCAGCDLRAANLQDADLVEALLFRSDLSGANLSGANLGGTSFEHATWCSGGCVCGDGSIDTCVGCASIDTCTGS